MILTPNLIQGELHAIDQLAHTYQQYKESYTHDLKSTMGTKAIELLEADE